MVPGYLQELKPEKQKQGRYMFCNKNDLAEQNWKITKCQKSFLFLPIAVSLWNKLDEKKTRTTTNYELSKNTLMRNINDNPLFFIGARQEHIIRAKLRMQCSNLNGHLYSMKIIDSPACS